MYRIRRRFSWVVGGAMFVFIALFTALEYRHLKQHIFDEAYLRTALVLAEVEAMQRYVREQLRPAVRRLLPPHVFLPQAMSTTFVAREMTERFLADNPDYYFKFAALEPRNMKNTADEFERGMIRRFLENPGQREWHGTVERTGGVFLVSATPIRMEASCLQCHGDPREAPAQLVKIYGASRGFGRRVGDIAGIRSVAIPIGIPLANARRLALTNLLFALGGMALLFVAAGYAFRRLVTHPLHGLEDYVTAIGRGDGQAALPRLGDDEIGLLGRTIERMKGQLRERDADLLHRNEELVQVRDDLRAAHAHLTAVFRAVPDGLLLINEDFTIADINQAACDLLGLRREEALGGKCYEVSHGRSTPCDGDEGLCPLREVFETGQDRRITKVHRAGNGVRHVEISAALLPAGGERGSQIIEALRDVTVSVQAHDLVARKSEELEGLMHALGHDLKTPLANIKWYSELLEIGSLSPEGAGDALQRVRNNAGLMSRLIDDLLEFSRIGIREEPGETTEVALALREALRIHEPRISGQRAEIVTPVELPVLDYPRSRLFQVFANLIGNALKHAEGREGLRIEIEYQREGLEHRFTVRDNGPGIDSVELAAIFEPFHSWTRRDRSSTGLGLSIVRRIVEKSGGRIWVQSVPGEGAAFSFTIPAS